MYVYTYVRSTYVCMYVCNVLRMYVYVRTYVCMHVCTYVRTHARMIKLASTQDTNCHLIRFRKLTVDAPPPSPQMHCLNKSYNIPM